MIKLCAAIFSTTVALSPLAYAEDAHHKLQQLKAGDKVKFQAEKVGGAFTITQLEPAN